jgi:DNA polymerase III epsilon subunit-like protein
MKVAVIDIETTALKAKNGHIVEVGIVQLDTQTGEVVDLLNSTVLEDDFGPLYRNAWIFQNTDLDFSRVMRGPLWRDVKDRIQAIVDRMPITAFNKDFDLGFLASRGITVKESWPCIMKNARHYTKIPRYNGDWKWPTVNEAWRHFFPGEPYDETHRALDDVRHEARILFEIIKAQRKRKETGE